MAFSVAGGDTASALAAGTPVIVKAHSAHPGTSELVGRAVRKAVQTHRLPEGTFSLIFGTGYDVGIALVTHPRIRATSFTGSRKGGLALVTAASAREVPIPVYAEMSSINPVFVFPSALGDRAAELETRLYRLDVHRRRPVVYQPRSCLPRRRAPGADEFVQAATDAVAESHAAPMLYPGLAAAYSHGVERLEENTGVTVAARGVDVHSIACKGLPGLFVTTADDFLADHDIQEEVFGPASVIVRVGDVDQLGAIVDRLDGQLTAAIHATSTDYSVIRPLLERLELLAGRIVFNGWPTGVEVGHAVIHGGPFPATSAPSSTSVGSRAIERFLRPVSYQNVPDELLAPELRTDNPLRISRRTDGVLRLR